MTHLQGLPVTIAGAGAFGLAAAVRLAQAGAAVTVCDPALGRDSASAVAAGMLAPAFEAALDPAAPPYDLMRAARDLWPALAEAVGAPDLLDRSGALLAVADPAALGPAARALASAAAVYERLDPAEVRARQPAAAEGLYGLFTPEDWRLEPTAALAALAAALRRAGGRLEPRRLGPSELGEGLVVVAGGAEAAALSGAAPELAQLSPIKGQILHYRGGPTGGPTLRGAGGYVAPQPHGAVAGASMEHGRADRALEPDALARLRVQAAALVPALAGAEAEGRAGVRAATPDGLPLVGRSAGGAILAVGARRNGWLLAPLVAELVVELVAGQALGPWAAALDPARFG
jgi:glycine oxidase